MRLFNFAKKLVEPRANLARAFVLCLAVFFLSAQSVSLVHAHDNDLTRHLDCELCLHIGGLDQALVDASVTTPLVFEHVTYDPLISVAHSSRVALPNSRAPPLIH